MKIFSVFCSISLFLYFNPVPLWASSNDLSVNDESKLFVFGRTKVGKSRFICQAVDLSGGIAPDISSDRLESHTTAHSSYSAFSIQFVDTVGYDDSADRSEEAIVKLLAETGKDPFYPPLIILRELSQVDNHWIDIMTQIFSQYVFAVRGSESAFQLAHESLLTKYKPMKIFHLNEFIDGDEDIAKKSRERYAQDVQVIISYYKHDLEATRNDIRFTSYMFHGDIKKEYVGVDTKQEIHKEEQLHETTQGVSRNIPYKKTVEAGGYWIRRGGIAGLLGDEKWVTTYKDIWVDNWVQVQERVQLKETKKYRNWYQREKYDLWKTLTKNNGFKIFVKSEIGEWTKTKTELLSTESVQVA